MLPSGDSFNIDPPLNWDSMTKKEKRATIHVHVGNAIYEFFMNSERQYSFEEIEDRRGTETEED